MSGAAPTPGRNCWTCCNREAGRPARARRVRKPPAGRRRTETCRPGHARAEGLGPPLRRTRAARTSWREGPGDSRTRRQRRGTFDQAVLDPGRAAQRRSSGPLRIRPRALVARGLGGIFLGTGGSRIVRTAPGFHGGRQRGRNSAGRRGRNRDQARAEILTPPNGAEPAGMIRPPSHEISPLSKSNFRHVPPTSPVSRCMRRFRIQP